jgi:hypothetical protein
VDGERDGDEEVQNVARLTGSDEPDYVVVAERPVSLPPSRTCEITHRVQVRDGRVQQWTLTGRLGVHIPAETVRARLKGDKDHLFRQLLRLSEVLPPFEFTQQDPDAIPPEYTIADLPE